MGTKNRPAPHDCYALAEGDEPLFVLLARDVHAPFLVRAWADMREASGESPDKVEEARSAADAMVRWRRTKRSREPMGDAAAAELLSRGLTVGQHVAASGRGGHDAVHPEGGADPAWDAASLDEVLGDLPDWQEPTEDGERAASAAAEDKPQPAANAPVIDVEGHPSGPLAPPAKDGASSAPSPPRAPHGVPIANVVELPDPETLARITAKEPLKESTKPPSIPPKPVLPPGSVEREVLFEGWVTLGAPGELLLRRVSEHVFEPATMTSNAPGLGFAVLTDFRVGNQRLLYGPSPADPSTHDFYQQDLYEYCAKGAGRTGVRSPRVAPSSAITLVVWYTGQVPDGYAFGAATELKIRLRGAATDRRML